jgi:hypothetical protein
MKKIKRWLIERILPVWAREQLLAEIRRLEEKNRQLCEENIQLGSYIYGLETGIKSQRRIIINTGEVKK